jgi:DNA-binding NarL/FixJ family response regulator
LLVEDDPLWQQGIQLLLSSDAYFKLAGTVDCYQDAIRSFQALNPQVVLLDWKIRGEPDGLAVGEWLLKTGLPPERIVLISGSSPSSIPAHPFLFIPKHQIGSELIPLLKSLFLS